MLLLFFPQYTTLKVLFWTIAFVGPAYENIQVSREDGVGIITLYRPKGINYVILFLCTKLLTDIKTLRKCHNRC